MVRCGKRHVELEAPSLGLVSSTTVNPRLDDVGRDPELHRHNAKSPYYYVNQWPHPPADTARSWWVYRVREVDSRFYWVESAEQPDGR